MGLDRRRGQDERASDPNAQWTEALVGPRGDVREDWWILDQICRRINLVASPAPGAQLLGRLGVRLTPKTICDLWLRVGREGGCTTSRG